MTTFKVGDRVRVYGAAKDTGDMYENFWSEAAEVIDSFNAGELSLTVRKNGCDYYVHPKQCRKLIKKQRRRLWVLVKDDNSVQGYSWRERTDHSREHTWIEFVEVKKK